MLKETPHTFLRFGSILQAPGVDRYRQRVLFVMLVAAVAFVILFGRLFYLQIIQGQSLRQQSETNSIRLQSIASTRGLIYDRNGSLLVDNRPSFNLTIVLKDAKPVAQTIENLSKYIDETPEALMEKIEQQKGGGAYKSIVLKEDIDRDLLAVVETHKYDLPGISVQVPPVRNYIGGELAAHMIGYLGSINAKELASEKYSENRAGDFIGKVGIEKVYESSLRGKRGGKQVEVSALGRVARVLKTVDATPGSNIFLTIDEALQNKAESLLEGSVGAAVAMDPQNGEILAMVSSPAFDPNSFVTGMSTDEWEALRTNPDKPLTNKVIQAEYPPASVYKIVMAMAGLEEGIIDEETVINCPGAYHFGGRDYRCWRWKYGGHGDVGIVQALAQSCDVFFYKVGEQLGVDTIAWYATACGLGETTGIDLDHEASGLIPTSSWKKRRFNEIWMPGETLNISIGQGYNLVTPLQALCLTAAVGNGGQRYEPQIVQSIKTAEGEVLYEAEPVLQGRLPVSRQTLDIVKQGLREVVAGAHGTAHAIDMPEVSISGKTGTAQVVSRKEVPEEADTESEEADTEEGETEEATELKDHAWFVAYAPSDQPRIAVAVIVEHGEHGSSAAAPIAGEIIKTYLGVMPTEETVAVVDSERGER
jgi:penicillin-binding protein 2